MLLAGDDRDWVGGYLRCRTTGGRWFILVRLLPAIFHVSSPVFFGELDSARCVTSAWRVKIHLMRLHCIKVVMLNFRVEKVVTEFSMQLTIYRVTMDQRDTS